jgi:hypothetical protein
VGDTSWSLIAGAGSGSTGETCTEGMEGSTDSTITGRGGVMGEVASTFISFSTASSVPLSSGSSHGTLSRGEETTGDGWYNTRFGEGLEGMGLWGEHGKGLSTLTLGRHLGYRRQEYMGGASELRLSEEERSAT